MDKVQDFIQATIQAQKRIVQAQELAYRIVSPDSEDGTFISDNERDDMVLLTGIIKELSDGLIQVARELEKSSPCSFCLHSKPPKETE